MTSRMTTISTGSNAMEGKKQDTNNSESNGNRDNDIDKEGGMQAPVSVSMDHAMSGDRASLVGVAGGGVAAAAAATSPGKASPSKAIMASHAVTAMSTLALEHKLKQLREESQQTSQILTAKLASSQSGQNLLHMGSRLSTLPPDLHALLQQLHPVLSNVEQLEREHLRHVTHIVQVASEMQRQAKRVQQAYQCAELYRDLVAAEQCWQKQTNTTTASTTTRTTTSPAPSRPQQQQAARRLAFIKRYAQAASVLEGSPEADEEGAPSPYPPDNSDNCDEEDGHDTVKVGDVFDDDLDCASSLERAAHVTLCLLQELQAANASLSAMTTTTNTTTIASNTTVGMPSNTATSTGGNNVLSASSSSQQQQQQLPWPNLRNVYWQQQHCNDTERAQLVLQLAPRIRRLEADVTAQQLQYMEWILQALQEHLGHRRMHRQQQQQQQQQHIDLANASSSPTTGERSMHSSSLSMQQTRKEETLLLMLGHCMRGLALLGRGPEVESLFARVAIMPLVRTKVSMGRLDQGGSRGECAGLKSLLQDMIESIADTYGAVLRMTETMFDVAVVKTTTSNMPLQPIPLSFPDVDLLTCGVWVPIATALMADAGIKMAIFSPGIASILQANYTVLDEFVSQLSERLLQEDENYNESDKSISVMNSTGDDPLSNLNVYRSCVTAERRRQAQMRIYEHPKTAEFSKKWNLPIYYQLRFGECCTRLNRAVDQTRREGWIAEVFSGSTDQAELLRRVYGFELSLFLELYDVLLTLWRPDVILRPLTNRILRGAVQLVGRVVAFISDGIEGGIKFGEEPATSTQQQQGDQIENGSDHENSLSSFPKSRRSYCWGDSEEDVAAVAWELTILESSIRHDYVGTICNALLVSRDISDKDALELRTLVTEVLKEASEQIHPIIDKAWNEKVVNILTSKCSAPLAAVKGVAATYRMTNRPPPTQASPFVATILRPLKVFVKEFAERTPDRVGSKWKHDIISTVATRYAAAVEELIATVQRTEVALKNRKARRAAAGGMGDGDKVKLQLFLDYVAFAASVHDVGGVVVESVVGIAKMQELTAEGENLSKQQNQNGS